MIRTAHGDVTAGMDEYVVKGLGRHLSVYSADDFRDLVCEEVRAEPTEKCAARGDHHPSALFGEHFGFAPKHI